MLQALYGPHYLVHDIMQEEEWLGRPWRHACAPEATPNLLRSIPLVSMFVFASDVALLPMLPQ